MFNKSYIGFSEKDSFLGEVVNYNFMTNKLQLRGVVGEAVVTKEVDAENVELMELLFVNNGVAVFNKDVVELGGNTYMIEMDKEGLIQFHQVNDKLEVVASGEKRVPTEQVVTMLSELPLQVLGNIYELEIEEEVDKDFNVKIAKLATLDLGQDYFYVCNNKNEESVDLIRVLFFGSNLLEESEYERFTLTYDEYENLVDSEIYEEITPQELQSHVMRVMRGEGEKTKPVANNYNKDEQNCDNCCDDCEEGFSEFDGEGLPSKSNTDYSDANTPKTFALNKEDWDL